MDIKDSAVQAGKSTWKWIKRLFLMCLLVFIGYFCFILFANYSDGTRTGYVVKISRKGVVFKTNEGELNFGFPQVNTAPGVSNQNIWYFSVPNSDVAKQIQRASETGQKVTLFYQQKYKQLFFRGDTEYLVYKMETAGDH